MGILSRGNATSEDKGASLGRGMGVGTNTDTATTNGALSPNKTTDTMAGMQRMDHDHMEGMDMSSMSMDADVATNANSVPGFPHDAFMEGPMMAMDKMVERPGNFGLRPGWSGFMQGMMSFVRVIPPDLYDKVIAQMQQAPKELTNTMPGMEHHHHGK